jgi:predicted Zn-dependent peptidase
MMWVGEHLLGFGEVFEPDEVVRRVHQVTAAAVHAIARDLFRASRLRLAVIGPAKEARSIERELKQL